VTKKIIQPIILLAVVVAIAVVVRNLTTPDHKADHKADYKTASSPTRMVMGTFVNITAVAADEETINKSFTAAFDKLTAVDEMMSDYKPESELSKVNRDAFKNPVKISDELFEVIKTALEYSKKTEGAFDITIGPVVELWRRTEKEGKKPTEKELAWAKARTGYEKLILDEQNRTIRFAVDGMILDLGAIAKGYAIDLAVEAMKETGVAGGLIDVGGDIRCFGVSPKFNNVWRIGMEDPTGTEDLLKIMNLTDTAIATSGDYRRFVMIDDKRFSHIINPQTTKSAAELTSVTVIATTAMQADALATSVSVMGQQEGLELIESLDGVEAILIPAGKELQFIKTTGAAKYISE
jgi:thiamine biosynthesis lipoprotein